MICIEVCVLLDIFIVINVVFYVFFFLQSFLLPTRFRLFKPRGIAWKHLQIT